MVGHMCTTFLTEGKLNPINGWFAEFNTLMIAGGYLCLLQPVKSVKRVVLPMGLKNEWHFLGQWQKNGVKWKAWGVLKIKSFLLFRNNLY